ncbi:peptide-methionine (S)-S-oxide reductase MsrA [[Mycoplasma] collis]|uniref:peptide-methionine (S)-S-oxide reductase MsrA n=1 Tax=[Mycoplasma] collis TaxID=2127 RepID=UPI00051C6022|nr:peptide-methionine (S)-S-oxide reductase MsrA [[Mycoplasma] collis]
MNKEIYLAGGCFWGVQAYFDKIKGILSSETCYINGGYENVNYKEVCNNSGHVEAVKIIYDDSIISEKEIWELFLRIIDPFSLNKQGNDIGAQYRVGVYAYDEKLLNIFKEFNKEFEKTSQKSNYLEFEIVKDFTKAEEYHQKYLAKNPNGYCHINLTNIPDKYLKIKK